MSFELAERSRPSACITRFAGASGGIRGSSQARSVALLRNELSRVRLLQIAFIFAEKVRAQFLSLRQPSGKLNESIGH